MEKLLNRFIKYVKTNTMSKENTNQTPSTKEQFDLAYLLKDELIELGLTDVNVNEHAIVTATLNANTTTDLTIGFIAHLDTIPGFSGKNVKPNIIKNYDGNDIVLNNITISPKEFNFLNNLVGKTLITTDGTTVLGADDKAGIAEIMTMLEFFKENPDIKHINIKVAFTPDEEIGGGIESFDVKKFAADFAYTVDGGYFDQINYENFNAKSAVIEFKGKDIHPGDAKGHMLNASLIAMEYHNLLPVFYNPMYTEGYEGFYHLCEMKGEISNAKLDYILRNHSIERLNYQTKILNDAATFLNNKYESEVVTVKIYDSYNNMYDKIKEDPRSIIRAKEAMKRLNINPQTSPIRGGTDGAKLTELGLNTPNLGTGGYNCHGPYELACLEEMQTVTNILIEIAKI